MLELTDAQKAEEIKDRVEKFKIELQSLSENYKVQLRPIVTISNETGVIPALSIQDLKYKEPEPSELNRLGRRKLNDPIDNSSK